MFRKTNLKKILFFFICNTATFELKFQLLKIVNLLVTLHAILLNTFLKNEKQGKGILIPFLR